MKTELLIHQLATEVRPVKPVGDPVTRFVMWFLAASVFIGIIVGFLGVRPDIAAALARPTYILRILFMFGVALGSVLFAFKLSVPDERKGWVEFFPALIAAVCLLLFAYLFFESSDLSRPYGYYCVRNVLAFSIPTSVLLYLMLKRAAPIRSRMVGMMAALGSTALSSLGTQFVCRNDSPLHILVSHVLPVFAASLAGVFVGQLIFKWDRFPRVFKSRDEHP
jgi:hypothetical protein